MLFEALLLEELDAQAGQTRLALRADSPFF